MGERAAMPEASCQVRPGEPCRLCMPGATGPEDCGLAYLVLHDPDLREELARLWAAASVR